MSGGIDALIANFETGTSEEEVVSPRQKARFVKPKRTETSSPSASPRRADASRSPVLQPTSPSLSPRPTESPRSPLSPKVPKIPLSAKTPSSPRTTPPSVERKKALIERTTSGRFSKFYVKPEEKNNGRQRLLVLQELIISEQDYVRDLAFIVQGFLQPLRNVGACSQDIPVIFGNIELLYSVNTDLLAKLNSILEEETENDEFLVGQIFCDMGNSLLSYDQYCTNHERAAARLQKSMKNPSFQTEVEKCRNRMVGTGKLLHLTDLMIKPVQRICKYPLLLKELLKCTAETHSDHIPLINAIQRIEEITAKINNSKRQAENQQTLHTIQRMLDGFEGKLDEPGRHFVREGTLHKVNPRGKVQARHFLLFSDMVIWCKGKTGTSIKKNHFQFKGLIRLDMAVVRDAQSTKAHTFQIIKLDTKKIYNLIADTKEEKLSWIKSIDELISVWLQVEKSKQDGRTLKSQDSFADSAAFLSSSPTDSGFEEAVMASPTLSRHASVSSPQKHKERSLSFNPDSKSKLTKSEPPTQQSMESRVTKLESLVEQLLQENASLKERVATLEEKSTKTKGKK